MKVYDAATIRNVAVVGHGGCGKTQLVSAMLFVAGAVNRMGKVDEFNKGDGPPLFFISLKAGGTGLNLTAASHVVLYDRWWNPAVEDQARDRAWHGIHRHCVRLARCRYQHDLCGQISRQCLQGGRRQ